mgnify:CR=1 FL=1
MQFWKSCCGCIATLHVFLSADDCDNAQSPWGRLWHIPPLLKKLISSLPLLGSIWSRNFHSKGPARWAPRLVWSKTAFFKLWLKLNNERNKLTNLYLTSFHFNSMFSTLKKNHQFASFSSILQPIHQLLEAPDNQNVACLPPSPPVPALQPTMSLSCLALCCSSKRLWSTQDTTSHMNLQHWSGALSPMICTVSLWKSSHVVIERCQCSCVNVIQRVITLVQRLFLLHL